MLRNKKKPAAEPDARPKRRKTPLLVTGLWLASLVLVVAATMWLSKPKPNFPLGYEANFIGSCDTKSRLTVNCFCSLRYVEEHYNYKEALNEDAQYKKTGHVSSDLAKAFATCSKATAASTS